MIGVEENHIFYQHHDGPTTHENGQFTPLGELPSLSESSLYFRQFLHTYDSALLWRELMQNIRFGKNVLQVNCQDILNCKPIPREECVQTPFCTRKDHIPPAFYLQQLYMALSLRPLHYLPACEEVCQKEALRSIHIGSDGNQALYDEKALAPSVQINLINTASKRSLIRELLAEMQEKFVVVPGIIVQASAPMLKINKMTIQCRFCDHKMAIQVPVWKEKAPIPRACRYSSMIHQGRGGAITENTDRQLGCNGQMDPYIIVPSECTYIDVQTLRMQEFPEDVPTGDMPRHLHLNASRYLCEKMAPGDRVYVHGVLTAFESNPKFKRPTDGVNSSYLHVLGIQRYDEGKGESPDFTAQELSYFENLAQSPDIHDRIFRSFAPAIYGMSNVKKAAAALVFGGTRKAVPDKSKLRGDINVLLLGDPSVAKSQILKFVDKVSPISVYTSGKGSSAAGLTAAVVRDRHGVFSLEGGAMVLGDGGVVCIDEFDKMNEDDVVAIHEAMEQQTISISKAGITTMLSTRCAVLAAANPSFGSFDDSQDFSTQHEFKTTILSRFDLIFMLRDKEDAEMDTKLCQHVVSLHAQKHMEQEGDIPIYTLRKYIQYAKQKCYPIISKDASDSLRNFYVRTRSDSRGDNSAVTRRIPITLRQLESLVRLAESFAKMELKDVATYKHVQMAIDLFIVSTSETAKYTALYEALSPADAKAVKQAEEAILGRLPKGQRATRVNLLRDLQMKGFDRQMLLKALFVLIKRGELEERGDLSVRRV